MYSKLFVAMSFQKKTSIFVWVLRRTPHYMLLLLYGDFPALQVEEDLRCPSVHYIRISITLGNDDPLYSTVKRIRWDAEYRTLGITPVHECLLLLPTRQWSIKSMILLCLAVRKLSNLAYINSVAPQTSAYQT